MNQYVTGAVIKEQDCCKMILNKNILLKSYDKCCYYNKNHRTFVIGELYV